MAKEPKWDYDLRGMGRKYPNSQDILSSIRDQGKVLIPSSDYIFPNYDTQNSKRILDQILEPYNLTNADYSDPGIQRYINTLRRRYGVNKGVMSPVSDATFDVAQTYEPKMYQALSEGIRNTYGFKPTHKIQDISKELASSMGVPNVPIEFKYMDGVGGATNHERIRLNPQHLNDFGRESIIAHELRHIKEGPGSSGPSIGKINTSNPLIGLRDALAQESLLKSKQGKDLQQFKKGGGFKPEIDALDIVSFFEGRHFKNPFIKENLQRVAKKLPIIGTAATVAGALGYSDMAGAATDMAIPGGIDEANTSPEQKMLDQRYLERLKSFQKRNK